ncbi:MAG: hypothetical protein LBE80_11135 [Deltaproteobacteria bacterium]|jgi:hypothetical protein|nr:hypothetical protein [Deltaproteobacteria bacterium]
MFLKLSSIFIVFIFTFISQYNTNNFSLDNSINSNIVSNNNLELALLKILPHNLTNKKKTVTQASQSSNILKKISLITFQQTMVPNIAWPMLKSTAFSEDKINQIAQQRDTSQIIIAQNNSINDTTKDNKDKVLSFNNYFNTYVDKERQGKTYDQSRTELTKVDFNLLSANYPIIREVFIGNNDLKSQKLFDVNIFYFLGVDSSPQAELDIYLAKLENFTLENVFSYLYLLLTDEEFNNLIKIINMNDIEINDKYKKISAYLVEKIPDINQLLAQSALGLKEDLGQTRIYLSQEIYENNPEMIEHISEAKVALASGLYRDAARYLSKLDKGQGR